MQTIDRARGYDAMLIDTQGNLRLINGEHSIKLSYYRPGMLRFVNHAIQRRSNLSLYSFIDSI